MNGQRIKKSPFLRGAWARYRKNTPALIGLVIIAAVILLAVFADVLAPYQETVLAQHPDQRFLGPSAEHLLGTDALGRDSFARLIHGARWSLALARLWKPSYCRGVTGCAGLCFCPLWAKAT